MGSLCEVRLQRSVHEFWEAMASINQRWNGGNAPFTVMRRAASSFLSDKIQIKMIKKEIPSSMM